MKPEYNVNEIMVDYNNNKVQQRSNNSHKLEDKLDIEIEEMEKMMLEESHNMFFEQRKRKHENRLLMID